MVQNRYHIDIHPFFLTNDIILGIQFATTSGLPMVLVSDKGHTGGLCSYAVHIFLTNQNNYTKTRKSHIYLYCLLYSYFRGYRTVAHTGHLWGHFSLYTLLPDIKLGIYTSLNGQEGSPSAMEHIAMYTGQCRDRNSKILQTIFCS